MHATPVGSHVLLMPADSSPGIFCSLALPLRDGVPGETRTRMLMGGGATGVLVMTLGRFAVGGGVKTGGMGWFAVKDGRWL